MLAHMRICTCVRACIVCTRVIDCHSRNVFDTQRYHHPYFPFVGSHSSLTTRTNSGHRARRCTHSRRTQLRPRSCHSRQIIFVDGVINESRVVTYAPAHFIKPVRRPGGAAIIARTLRRISNSPTADRTPVLVHGPPAVVGTIGVVSSKHCPSKTPRSCLQRACLSTYQVNVVSCTFYHL